MAFKELLTQVIDWLQREQRVSYRALKRQFDLDDDDLEAIKDEIIEAKQLAADERGTVLVWTGATAAAPPPVTAPVPTQTPGQVPLSYTPPHLTDKILASRTALAGERKQVTVLFADIKDSTELISDRDPEEAQEFLDPAIHIMMEGVHRYEGTVNQVLGDGIMALFGAPIAHEDHALRASYAALAMQAAMRDYTDEMRRAHGIEMRIRVGLNSGEVVVRTIGNDLHIDYSAVGPTTHLAARMEQLATPGTIRLTAATLRLVEGLVRVHPLGPVPVKGIPEPVEVFELLGASAIRRRFQAVAERGLTQFVGRETEIATLNQIRERAEAGHGQVVAVVGEAGVGKSRLVYEFIHSHRTQGWRVLESASVSYGKATPYFPVVDLLKHYVHLDDQDDVRTIRAKVTGHVLTLDDTLHETIPPLLALLEALPDDSPFLRLDPSQRRQRTLNALRGVLLRESQEQPLLLVFEDLHWIDAETQALLDNLVVSLPTVPLLLLVNYRPEYQHSWGSKPCLTQLRLEPLPPENAEALLQMLLGTDPKLTPLKHHLVERTAGNPFFLEESVRTLVETGALVGARSAYRLAQILPTIQIPATVQAVLAARIDRLAPDDKYLLQTAAVVGTEVPWPLLQAIAALPQTALHRGMMHLQAAEFIDETRLFPEREYTFKHTLTHEVAYSSLLQGQRRALHAQIVEVLEGLAGDRLSEQIERLARHALLGEVWPKALTYFRQAGAKALARSAYRESMTCFEQALVALHHLPESRTTYEQGIDVRFALREALMPLGELQRVLKSLYEAESLAKHLGDNRRLGRTAAYLANLFWEMGEHDSAIAHGQRALEVAETLGDRDLQEVAQRYLGRSYYALGDYPRAIDILRHSVAALTEARRHEHPGPPAGSPSRMSHIFLTNCLAEVGAFAEGLSHGETVLSRAGTGDRPFDLSAAYTAVGRLYLRKGDLSQAIPALERGMELCQAANLPLLLPHLAAPLGAAYTLHGQLADAIPLLKQAVERAEAMGRLIEHSLSVAWLGEAHLLAGQVTLAHELAARALADAQRRKEHGCEAWILHLLGTIHAQRDVAQIVPAAGYYQQALALAEARGMRPLQAHCHLGLGALYAQQGRGPQAQAALTRALALYRSLEMTLWLPQVETALAHV